MARKAKMASSSASLSCVLIPETGRPAEYTAQVHLGELNSPEAVVFLRTLGSSQPYSAIFRCHGRWGFRRAVFAKVLEKCTVIRVVWPQVSEDLEIPASWSSLGPTRSPLLFQGLEFTTDPFSSALFTLNFSIMKIYWMHVLIKLVFRDKHLYLVCISFTLWLECQVLLKLDMDASFYLSISFILTCPEY